MADRGRIRSYGEVIRERIDSAMALDVLHAAMRGEDVTRTQLEACRIALGKVLPDLKAVAVALDERKALTKADIDAMLLSAGLQPALEHYMPHALPASDD